MGMSKKDFIALADCIKGMMTSDDGSSLEFDEMVSELAKFCRSQNPRFMEDRWLDYIADRCGKNGGAVKASKAA